MLDFICMVVAELWVTGIKQKIQNENSIGNRNSELFLFAL